MTKAKNILLSLALALASLLLCFGVLEVVLHLSGPPPSGAMKSKGYINFAPSVIVGPNPYYAGQNVNEISRQFFTYRPYAVWANRYPDNPRGYFNADNDVVYTMNSFGMRDREYSLEKPPGTLRIAVLGDSFTFGEGVWLPEIYPKVMETLLRGSGCSSCEVLNFGVNGYDIRQIMILLQTTVLRFQPDVVLYGYMLNDVSSYVLDTFNERMGAAEASFPLLHTPFFSLTFIGSRLWNSRLTRRTIETYEHLYRNSRLWGETSAILAAMRDLLAARGVKFFTVIFPDLMAVGRKTYPYAALHEQLQRFLEKTAIPWFDMTDIFRRRGTADLMVHPIDHHPNEIGHRIIAETIVAELRRRGLVP